MQRKPAINQTTTTNTPPRIPCGPITEQLSDLLRTLMATLGTAYAVYETPPAVAQNLETAKTAVLAARAAAHGEGQA
jgi:hypothetical protein